MGCCGDKNSKAKGIIVKKRRHLSSDLPKRLFIGGPYDGRRIPDVPADLVYVDAEQEDGTTKKVAYRRSNIKTAFNLVTVRVCECIEEKDILLYLLAHYSPPRVDS